MNSFMSKSDPVHTLMVHPPSATLSSPPWQMPWMALHLSGCGLTIAQYDANIEFFTQYLLKPENLKRFIAEIETREARGAYKAADPGTLLVLNDLAANRPRWDRRIERAGHYLAACREDGFYRPEHGLDALDNIGALLKLASLACYPSRIRWGAFSNSEVGDRDRILAFAVDEDTNPFLAFCRAVLAPKFRKPGLRRLLLWVISPDQLPASATMAVFSKRMNPDLHVAVAGEPGLLAGCEMFADSLLEAPDAKSFSELVQFAGGNVSGETANVPDFSSLSYGQYLAPATVIPIDLTAGGGLKTASASVFFNMIKVCREKLGAKGFLITADSCLPELFTGMARAASDKEPALSLGFCTRLREACREMEGETLCRAGAKLIIWQTPEGSLAVLKEVLGRMSRAGIWNHLKIPNRPDDDLVKALTYFAAANPNIVHSWSHNRSPGMLTDNLADPTVGPDVYSRVRKLPGRPLWQKLNDPVYLLLYLERHGIQKVMRWRVSDRRPGVYTLGRNLEYHFEKPGELPPGYLDEICLMVEAGGSVNMEIVRYNLERAFLIAYVVENDVIVGNSSLKHPRPAYIKTVSRQSGLDLAHYVERGYTSVRPEYRGLGIGARLLEGLTERAGSRKVFSVISEDNAAARKMAIRNRTRQVAEYYSQRLGKRVGVWIPEWML